MSKTVSWNDFGNKSANAQRGSKQQGQRPLRFVKIGENESIVVRPVDEAVEFEKYVHQDRTGKWNFGVCGDITTCPVYLKYGKTPSTRYAINVIDRTDNLIKIYEGPLSVFKVFASYKEMSEEDAGGENGADFRITKNVSFKDGKKYTRYEVHKECRSIFTAKEKTLINTTGEGIYNLERIFKVTPIDQIEKKVLGADYSGGDEAPQQQAPQQQAPQQQAPQEETGRHTSELFQQESQAEESDIQF